MSSRRHRPINMPAPYLRRVWLDPARVTDPAAYPFCLPFLQTEFELSFERAITIIVGENGTGKSTLLEGIAVLAGYDEAGGGKGYRPVDHSIAIDKGTVLPTITDGFKGAAPDLGAYEFGSAPPHYGPEIWPVGDAPSALRSETGPPR